MSDDDAGHGRGRPQKFPGEGARISHSLRLTPAMAERLRSAAQEANRTLGEEMELRINRSFEKEDLTKEKIDAEVASRTYYVAREAEFYRTEHAYYKASYEWELASHQKYIKELEVTYFDARLRYIKKVRKFLGNRLSRFLMLEEKFTGAAVDKNHEDTKSFDEKMAEIDIRGRHLKSVLENFNNTYPELMDSRYIGVIVSVMDSIQKAHAERKLIDGKGESGMAGSGELAPGDQQ